MNRYLKISAALAAFALLLVVMGLSTSNVVQAQKTITAASPPIYICTDRDCNLAGATPSATDHDNVFTVGFGGDVIIQNLDLPRVTQKIVTTVANTQNNTPAVTMDGPDANPKRITLTSDLATIVAVHQSSGLTDARFSRVDDLNDDNNGDPNDGWIFNSGADATYEVKAFNGNRIQVTYTPTGGQFATIKTVPVDNVKPQLVTNSPTIPLIVTDSVDLTFSADITDSGSGYKTTKGTRSTEGEVDDLDDGPNPLAARAQQDAPATNGTSHGGIRLVVAGNNVALGSGDFTKIDDGWRVSKTINSSAIQNISANNPWYFETKDRAGNVRRTSGSISGTTSGPNATGTNPAATTLVDSRYDGFLNGNSFAESRIRITRNDANGNPVVSNAQPITVFSSSGGVFTFPNTYTDATTNNVLFDDVLVYSGPSEADVMAAAEDAGSAEGSTITDAEQAAITAAANATAAAEGYQCRFDSRDSVDNPVGTGNISDSDGAMQLAACGALAKGKYEILGSNLITVDSEEPVLENTETGIGYDSGKKAPKVQKNSIKLTFSDLGSDSSAAPGSGLDSSTVTPGAFSVSGNAVESVAVVGNSVYLTLADNLGSTEQPSVSVQSGVIKDKAGNAFGGARVGKASDKLGPNLSLSKSADLSNDEITITITSDEQLNASPTVTLAMASDKDGNVGTPTVVDSTDVRQADSLSYTYAHSVAPTTAKGTGGEFTVHATGSDTGENDSSTGDAKSSSSAKAFTFELDKALNGGEDPVVSVSDNKDVQAADSEAVEQVDPMIVTVDFSREGREYDRDSYRTVELTSAKLKVTFDDGTSENRTFNLTTEISSPDNVKFTIPLLNPKIGDYTLTVQAIDQAGNVRPDGTGTTPDNMVSTWEVIAPSPVDIALAPGWNLVSLPFQPANPAINSVIAASHPADIVMTYDNASQVWLVSRRDAETGLFVGDIPVMTASTAYFIRTENFQALRMLRPPIATAAAAPPPPPAITVVKGWNLVPVVSNDIPTPKAIAADDYFGTLGGGSDAGWLKALTFDTLVRTWTSVTPGETMVLEVGETNPCTGAAVVPADVKDGSEQCQVGQYSERSRDTTEDLAADPRVDSGEDGFEDTFDGNDKVTVRAPVAVGKGYWLYATADGVIIP